MFELYNTYESLTPNDEFDIYTYLEVFEIKQNNINEVQLKEELKNTIENIIPGLLDSLLNKPRFMVNGLYFDFDHFFDKVVKHHLYINDQLDMVDMLQLFISLKSMNINTLPPSEIRIGVRSERYGVSWYPNPTVKNYYEASHDITTNGFELCFDLRASPTKIMPLIQDFSFYEYLFNYVNIVNHNLVFNNDLIYSLDGWQADIDGHLDPDLETPHQEMVETIQSQLKAMELNSINDKYIRVKVVYNIVLESDKINSEDLESFRNFKINTQISAEVKSLLDTGCDANNSVDRVLLNQKFTYIKELNEEFDELEEVVE